MTYTVGKNQIWKRYPLPFRSWWKFVDIQSVIGINFFEKMNMVVVNYLFKQYPFCPNYVDIFKALTLRIVSQCYDASARAV